MEVGAAGEVTAMSVDARNATLWQLILAKLIRSLSLVLAVSLAVYQPQLRPWTAFALLDVSREWSMFTHKWPAGRRQHCKYITQIEGN